MEFSYFSALAGLLAVVGALGYWAAVLSLAHAFRSVAVAQPEAGPILPFSMIVPITGTDAHTEAHLDALVSSALESQVEYIFAMETADDPAYAVCQHVSARHPDRDIRVIVTGPANGRMGKQHNLAVALGEARHEAIGSMDADVLVEQDSLAAALRALSAPGVGVAYFLPCYQGPGPAGGTLVALYSNYYFAPNIGSLALRKFIPLTIGSLWLTTKITLKEIGGLERFGGTVSDDAAIGRAVAKVGRENILLPHTVRIPYEAVDLRGGAKHLLKWLTLLRAEGLITYIALLLTWHPILWATGALIGDLVLREQVSWLALMFATYALAVAIGFRIGTAYQLDHWVYHQRSGLRPLLLIPYELLAVPALFTIGLFRHTIVWRGRRYRIGRHGAILASGDA